MESIGQTVRRKHLVMLNRTLTLLGVGTAIFVLVAERVVHLGTADARLLLSVLLAVLTFQVTQIMQALILNTKLDEFSFRETALEQLGDARELVDDLLRKLTGVHQKHAIRCKNEGISRDSRTFLYQQQILSKRIDRLLKDTIQNVDELLDGKFHTYFWACRVLHEAVEHMDRRLIGLSPLSTTDDNWWTCPDGEEFLTVNRNAVKAGKRVTRIFVYEPEQRAQLESLLAQHSDAATELYSIDVATLAKRGFGDRPEAVAVVDDALMFGAETGVPNRHYDWNKFSLRPDRIKAKLEELEKIRRAATPHPTNALPPATKGTKVKSRPPEAP